MKIRKYFFASLLLIIFLGGVVHFKHEVDFTTDFFGTYITLPISVWFSLPLLILFFASFFHISYYNFKRYIKDRSEQKDKKNLTDAIKRSLLSESSTHEYKNDEYKNLANLIENSKIYLSDTSIKTNIDEIDSIVELQKSIQNGEVVNLGSLKLSEDNEYRVQNIYNKIQSDLKYAKEVIRNNTKYSQQILKWALLKLIAEKNENDIKNGIKNIEMDKEIAFKLFDLYGESLHLSFDELKTIVEDAKLSSYEFIELSKVLKPKMIPDDLMSMFDNLSTQIDNAKDAYVYVLLDLEMIQLVKDLFETSDEDEYSAFKAYLSLKENGIDYDLDKFIRGIY
jgi:hypothetical protein